MAPYEPISCMILPATATGSVVGRISNISMKFCMPLTKMPVSQLSLAPVGAVPSAAAAALYWWTSSSSCLLRLSMVVWAVSRLKMLSTVVAILLVFASFAASTSVRRCWISPVRFWRVLMVAPCVRIFVVLSWQSPATAWRADSPEV